MGNNNNNSNSTNTPHPERCLRDAGALDDDEFKAAKAQLLAKEAMRAGKARRWQHFGPTCTTVC